MTPRFDLRAPEHFTAGTVGPPGQRVFYIQAREGRQRVTLKSEKEQVRALAAYLAHLLDQASPRPTPAPGAHALEPPIEPAFAVGEIGLVHDEAGDRFVIELRGAAEEEGEDPGLARFTVTPAQAAAFVQRAEALMSAGRPICPMCSQPKDPAGHVCPRSNGHVVHG